MAAAFQRTVRRLWRGVLRQRAGAGSKPAGEHGVSWRRDSLVVSPRLYPIRRRSAGFGNDVSGGVLDWKTFGGGAGTLRVSAGAAVADVVLRPAVRDGASVHSGGDAGVFESDFRNRGRERLSGSGLGVRAVRVVLHLADL